MLADTLTRLLFTIWIPLAVLVPVSSFVEALLTWANHPRGFMGIYLLKSSDLRVRLAIPPDAQTSRGRVGDIWYLISGDHEVLFTGAPSLFRPGYVLKVRACDLGGATRLEIRAPVSVCLSFVALSALFLGVALVAFATGGLMAGVFFSLVGVGLVAILARRVKRQVAAAPSHLEDILTHLTEEEGKDTNAT